MGDASIYAAPRKVTDLGDCDFYHTMEIPGYGLVQGQWDLRAGIRDYLGNLGFAGKRVLEVGTASGFLCFEMERQGAEVVAYDLSDADAWDLVPMAGIDFDAEMSIRKKHIRRLNNSYWLAHRAFASRARVVYGDAYSIPEAIGEVDICLFASVLLHLRDPFLALQRALSLTRETVIVTDRLARRSLRNRMVARLTGPHMLFLPDHRKGGPLEAWWYPSAEAVVRMVGVLGFNRAAISHHAHPFEGVQHRLFTVVAHRV